MEIHLPDEASSSRGTILFAVTYHTFMHISEALARQLDKIELQMKEQMLWADTAPEPAQLASIEPFACDTLSFEQWLQFILVPRFREMLANPSLLPRAMAVAPAAEVALPASKKLISLLNELDHLINSHSLLLTPDRL